MEPVIAGRIADIIRDSGKEVVVCSCDECGGTINTTCRAVRYAKEFVIKASEQKRVEVPISELMLGVECGGSDSVSGLISNPATGMVADKVVDEGRAGSFVRNHRVDGRGGIPPHPRRNA